MLDLYTKKKEYDFFRWALDNSSIIESTEKQSEALFKTSNYRSFVSQVISEYMDISQVHGPKEKYIDQILMALEICSYITHTDETNKTSHKEYLTREIDRIL